MSTKTIKLPDTSNYHDLYDITGLALGSSIIVSNNTGSQLRLIQYSEVDDPEPKGVDGFIVYPGQTVLVHGNDMLPILAKGGVDGTIVVQPLTSTVMNLVGVEFPQDIVTSGKESFRRLQVDNGQTGFFEGREFRLVRKLRLSGSGDKLIFKFESLVDLILFEQDFSITSGNYEFHVWRANNVTEDTPFTNTVTFFNKNNSDNEYRDYDGGRYQSQVTISTGGTITVIDPDLYSDYSELKTSQATAQKTTVSAAGNRQRYVNAGTYYLEFTALSSDVRGIYTLGWEERPLGTK